MKVFGVLCSTYLQKLDDTLLLLHTEVGYVVCCCSLLHCLDANKEQLGTSDLEEAKLVFAEEVLADKIQEQPELHFQEALAITLKGLFRCS